MSKEYTILPCNGLDKCAGCMTKEVALAISERSNSEIICPIFYRVADARYSKLANENQLLVIDGCQTRCASKLASEKGLKIAKKITITEEVKKRGYAISDSLRLGKNEVEICNAIADSVLNEEALEMVAETVNFPETHEYETFKKDKFIFRVPKQGFLFNENDCWAYVAGNIARIGVTDFVQQSLSDIMFFTPPAIGAQVEQFGEAGVVESGKAVFELVSPVSGTIKSVNTALIDNPEYINQNPYEKGWIAEIELAAFEEDKDLLIDWQEYLEILKRKVAEFHV